MPGVCQQVVAVGSRSAAHCGGGVDAQVPQELQAEGDATGARTLRLELRRLQAHCHRCPGAALQGVLAIPPRDPGARQAAAEQRARTPNATPDAASKRPSFLGRYSAQFRGTRSLRGHAAPRWSRWRVPKQLCGSRWDGAVVHGWPFAGRGALLGTHPVVVALLAGVTLRGALRDAAAGGGSAPDSADVADAHALRGCGDGGRPVFGTRSGCCAPARGHTAAHYGTLACQVTPSDEAL